MGKIKKNRNQDKKLQTIVLVTALLKLVEVLMDIIKKLIE